ncbi:hypothetical protein CANCADRAFT_44899 [Tortispora caseinolytica NRRL Y-17796]|uniref:Uncharacterized protein n=1 Tax=Tortispora caseinolytica NRRL Y-17796 TaxID=767744 RepID=A0A1E4THS5_9ASCO|nr:hypothetical protein CANCADRAFT_44899 [Tortispora caseinolytica NRRL Y-17796]
MTSEHSSSSPLFVAVGPYVPEPSEEATPKPSKKKSKARRKRAVKRNGSSRSALVTELAADSATNDDESEECAPDVSEEDLIRLLPSARTKSKSDQPVSHHQVAAVTESAVKERAGKSHVVQEPHVIQEPHVTQEPSQESTLEPTQDSTQEPTQEPTRESEPQEPAQPAPATEAAVPEPATATSAETELPAKSKSKKHRSKSKKQNLAQKIREQQREIVEANANHAESEHAPKSDDDGWHTVEAKRPVPQSDATSSTEVFDLSKNTLSKGLHSNGFSSLADAAS